ncbi:MAG: TonB-dependent receptor [bacterium]
MRFMRSLIVLATISLFAAGSVLAAGGTIKGKVTTTAGEGIPNAQVVITGTTMGASANANGEYIIRNVPAGTYAVRTQVIGYQTKTATIRVRADEDATLDFSLEEGVIELSGLVTIGSRAVHAAADQLAVPVDVFSIAEIRQSGASETNQIIQNLAPSFNFPRPSVADGTDSMRPATLRGLGPDQVLVLINGKRRHTGSLVNVNGTVGRGSTGVDLNAIPASAIERVEVLRDGAAAQYGSDAIAGVIGLSLRSGVSPLTISVKAGATTHDSKTLESDPSFDLGFGDGELLDLGANYGFAVGKGSVFIAGEYRDRNPTNRAGRDPREQIVAGDAATNTVPQPNHHWGDSKSRDWMAFVNANFPLSESGSNKFYAFGGYSHRFGSHAGFYRRSLQAQNWPQIYPLGFLPTIEPDINDYSGTVGLQGVAKGWIYDVSAQLGHNKFDFNIVNSLNTSLGPSLTSTTSPAPFPNQAEFYSGGFRLTQYLANADFTKQFDAGLRSPLNFALGAEFRRENYQIVAGEEASYIDGKVPNRSGGRAAAGAQVFPGFKPENEVDASRNSFAFYADVEASLIENVLVGMAGRFENYDDFGSTLDGKLALRWQPAEQLVFRGAASTGFRAPSLGQIYFNATSTNFLVGASGQLEPFEIGTFRVDSPVAQALGASELKPEESVHFSGGIAVDPLPNLNLTADYYRINIDDRIVFSENFTGGVFSSLLDDFGVNGARFFTNAIDTRTQGADFTANYRLNVGEANTLKFSAGVNFTDNKITGKVPNPKQLAGFEAILFGDLERVRLEGAQPKNNLKFSANYAASRFSALLRLNYYGEYESIERGYVKGRTEQTFGAEDVWDVELGYKFGNLNITTGAQNVFDNFPDSNLFISTTLDRSNFGIFPYPGASPFGMNGRFLYVKTTYSL